MKDHPMKVTLVGLEEAADLIEVSHVTRRDDHPSSTRLDLDHPKEGKLTTIQAGSEVFLIHHTQPEARTQ
jgi:hypothetical protein